jgi:hypothetical protein
MDESRVVFFCIHPVGDENWVTASKYLSASFMVHFKENLPKLDLCGLKRDLIIELELQLWVLRKVFLSVCVLEAQFKLFLLIVLL